MKGIAIGTEGIVSILLFCWNYAFSHKSVNNEMAHPTIGIFLTSLLKTQCTDMYYLKKSERQF